MQLRLGLGDQNTLSEYITKVCPDIINREFQEAIQEKTEKEKEIYEPMLIPTRAKQLDALMYEKSDQEEEKVTLKEEGLNLETWKKEIGKLRGSGESVNVKDLEKERILYEYHL